MKIDNKGSTTIEMSMVMPIVLGILVMVITLFVNLYVGYEIFARTYKEIYSYDTRDYSEREIEQDLKQEIEKHYTGRIKVWGMKSSASNGEIRIKLLSMDNEPRKIYTYNGDVFTYNTEYDKCTDRLRRWQLLGDFICE